MRRFLVEFYRLTGVAAKLVPSPAPGQRIRFGTQENAYCRAMSRLNEECENCYQADLGVLRASWRNLKPQRSCCRAGLVRLAVPVLVSGRPVATLIGGKVRINPESQRQFAALTRRLQRARLDRELPRLRSAFSERPLLQRRQFAAAVGLLDAWARLLVAPSLRPQLRPAQASADPPCVAAAKKFIQDHLAERLTTRDASHALHLSEAYFCRLFHRLTGTTFHDYVAHARVETAKALLQTTSRRVTEIVFAVGFQSASDFNRVFKRLAGVTPTEFRQADSRVKRAV
jgi:AraC-like DNA-binding protein